MSFGMKSLMMMIQTSTPVELARRLAVMMLVVVRSKLAAAAAVFSVS